MILKQKSRNFWGKNPAFSLIEIIVVIALITTLISITIPKDDFLTKTLIDNETENLFTAFYYLRQKAIASNTRQVLNFSTEKNSYSYKFSNKTVTKKLSKKIKFDFIPNAKGPPSNPKKTIDRAITFRFFKDYKKVFFYPSGNITAGTIYLTDKKQKLMNALTCSISQVSFIRKYRYDKNLYKKWVLI